MEENFDREYYIAAINDNFPCDDLDAEQYFEAVNKAIDKTLQAYTKNGKLLVEDWDMFDQDLYTNASNELDKLYD
jgi:DNA-binding ferritin-like protein